MRTLQTGSVRDTAVTPLAVFVPGELEGSASEKDLAELVKEITWLGERNMYNKALRKYKALRKLGGYPDGPGYSAVLRACAKGRVGAVADKVVSDMLASPPEGGISLADLKVALTACALGSRPSEAMGILSSLEEAGLSADMECYTLAMRSCLYAPAAMPYEEIARKLMKRVRKLQKTDLGGEYYGLLLQILVRARRFEEAVACFDLMGLDEAFAPTPDHYVAAMKAATATKNQDLVKSLLGEVLMDEKRFGKSYAPLMEMAAKSSANSNNWRLAVKLLDKVPPPAKYDTYHAVVASCGRNGNPKQALALFAAMKEDAGYRPNRATYNAVLHACSANGELAAAKTVLEQMAADGVRLNVVTYNIALNSRAKAGDARGAVNLLAEMEEAGIEPSVVSFATAINAAAQYNSSALAVTLLDAMGPSGVQPNAHVFTAALTACENDPDDVAAARAAQLIVDKMAEVGWRQSANMDPWLKNRVVAQVKSLLGRDLSHRDLDQVKKDEEILGVKLSGRQTAL